MSKLLTAVSHLTRRLTGFTRKSVVVDGVRWAYVERGAPEATPVVLLHGFGAEKDHWLAYGRRLANGYRVICPDLPGFGESERGAAIDYRIGAQASRLRDFLRAVGAPRVHLAGNSMGGWVALRLALDHPDALRTLTLMNCAGIEGAEPSELEASLSDGVNPLVVRDPDGFDRLMAMVMHRPMWMPRVLKRRLVRKGLQNASLHEAIFSQIMSDEGNLPLNGELSRVETPTLVVWGRQDRVLDVSCAAVLESAIPDCRSVIFDDTGHVPMMERPREAAAAHQAFIESHAAR